MKPNNNADIYCAFCHIVALFSMYVILNFCGIKVTSICVKSSGCTSDGLTCITLDTIPTDMTVECILDYINETGRAMHLSQKVSVLRLCSLALNISTCLCAVSCILYIIVNVI